MAIVGGQRGDRAGKIDVPRRRPHETLRLTARTAHEQIEATLLSHAVVTFSSADDSSVAIKHRRRHATSVVAPEFRLSKAERPGIIQAVRDAAHSLSSRLGALS